MKQSQLADLHGSMSSGSARSLAEARLCVVQLLPRTLAPAPPSAVSLP
jgi:hypothetical protein